MKKNIIAIFSAFAANAAALALPQTSKTPNNPSSNGVQPPFPTSVTVTYYNNRSKPSADSTNTASSTCDSGNAVDTTVLEAESCCELRTDGIAIPAAPRDNCTFTVFTGSTACSSGEAGDGGEEVRYVIPAGSGSLCVDMSMLGVCGGQGASGVWACG